MDGAEHGSILERVMAERQPPFQAVPHPPCDRRRQSDVDVAQTPYHNVARIAFRP
jgi:hypothetical protein